MKVKRIMTTNIDSVEPRSTIRDAAQKMRVRNVGSLPVLQGDKVLGIITDRDIALRAVADGRDPTTSVADIMSATIVCCYDEQNVEDVAELMSEHQVRRIPVVNSREQLVGIVSLGDIATEAGDDRLTAAALEKISKPAVDE